MKEMHKWKDKVEVSLDNRQIFFLFFGVSVVGCFVFGLGMMAGRQIDFDVHGEGVARPQESLAMLEAAETLADDPEEDVPFSFKQGLKEPTLAAVVPTVAASDEAPASDLKVASVAAPAHSSLPPASIASVAERVPPAPSAAAKTTPSVARKPTVAVSKKAEPAAPPKPDSAAKALRPFTLQMKAFSKRDEADAFAADLRARGHEVRVESHEIKGRVWYRVRIGAFTTWSDGLAAKEAFEKNEKVIAYVVRQ